MAWPTVDGYLSRAAGPRGRRCRRVVALTLGSVLTCGNRPRTMDQMRLPLHAWLGLALLAVSEGAMLAHVEPFWTWHTPFAWTGYILLLDGIVYRLRGSSWLTTSRSEFVFLALVSIPLWVVFEGYNLLIENWHYINLPENLVLRYFGYA